MQENNNILELIKEYDITFNADMSNKVNSDTTKIISDLFTEYVENVYDSSSEYKRISKVAKNRRTKLENTMTDKQKKLLECYCEKKNESLGAVLSQTFVYGFCFANQIRDTIGNFYIIKKK